MAAARFARSGIAAACSAAFVLPYVIGPDGSLLRYATTDAVVLACAWAGWGRRASASFFGITGGWPLWACALVLAVGGGALAAMLLERLQASSGVVIAPGLAWFSLSQVAHQEIFLRGALLPATASLLGSPAAASVGAAALFTALHPLFFGGFESWLVLWTLFAMGLAGNALFFRFGSIALPLAIHAAWNLNRFGEAYRSGLVSEAESFSVFEGAPETALAAGVLLAACLALAVFPPRDRAREPE